MTLSGELFRFGVVGSVGFLVDASVLQMLVSWFDGDLLISRIFSYLAAATVTWFLHHIYTSATNTPRQTIIQLHREPCCLSGRVLF